MRQDLNTRKEMSLTAG